MKQNGRERKNSAKNPKFSRNDFFFSLVATERANYIIEYCSGPHQIDDFALGRLLGTGGEIQKFNQDKITFHLYLYRILPISKYHLGIWYFFLNI